MKGLVRTKREIEPTFDDLGMPIENENSFGSEIPCQYQSANINDVVETGDGIFTQARYIITVKKMDFNGKLIQLINSRNQIVCEKEVKSLEVLEKIKRVKIII